MKTFDGTTYQGTIVSRYDGQYYRVSYGDYDDEDLEHEEIEQLLENKKANNYEIEAEVRNSLLQTNLAG